MTHRRVWTRLLGGLAVLGVLAETSALLFWIAPVVPDGFVPQRGWLYRQDDLSFFALAIWAGPLALYRGLVWFGALVALVVALWGWVTVSARWRWLALVLLIAALVEGGLVLFAVGWSGTGGNGWTLLPPQAEGSPVAPAAWAGLLKNAAVLFLIAVAAAERRRG